MLDTVRVSGRLISVSILKRIQSLCDSPGPPSRRELVKRFCREANWRNAKGQLCEASANVALKRLGELNLLRLPAPLRRGPSSGRRRKLRDDGQELPPLPKLSATSELSLQLIKGSDDPDHLLWNRLIIREHPLGGAPLFGPQLRYLVRCQEGVVGAFGIGPASYHLECRDVWIGWNSSTRIANLGRVIGLSRFLIRPGVRAANLASRCYSMLGKRVANDWQERYGIEPVLIETFVDQQVHNGISLAASNWLRLGQSRGRGRSTPRADILQSSPKDVWVYQLRPKARAVLLECPEPLVVPRSVLASGQTLDWMLEEFDGLKLGDRRLEKRLPAMLEGRWNHPQRSFCRSFDSWAQTKAAYRLIESREAGISFENLIEPHQAQTHRRMAAERIVILPQDTTTISYNTLDQTEGLGRVGDRRNPGRGFFLHSMQAYRIDGIPLGNAWAKLWVRTEECATKQRNQTSVADKESLRWLEACQVARRLALRMARTHLMVCGDRESDIFELFEQAEHSPENLHLLVRSQHDRLLTSGEKLHNHLSKQEVIATLPARVSRNKGQPPRSVVLEVRMAAVELAPPQVTVKRKWKPVRVYVVSAQETDPPPGVEPVKWVLLTDWVVKTRKMAMRLIRWYALRWGIECWHQVLKDGCGIEKRKMKSQAALERALTLDMIVAWRAQLLVRLGKEHPDLPAHLFYTEEELAVLEDYKKKLPRHARSESCDAAPSGHQSKEGLSKPGRSGNGRSSLTVLQANILVAMLAGFLARKSDGYPGPRVLGEGLTVLAAIVRDRRLFRPQITLRI